jgi:hypothetical protein
MPGVSNLRWFAGQVEARLAEEAAASQAPDDYVLTLAEAADVARVSTRTLYRAARSGGKAVLQVRRAIAGRCVRALRDWMRERDQDAAAKPAKGVLAEVEAIREGSK